MMEEKDYVRFWSKVNKNNINGCWEWVGGFDQNGYGSFWINGKHVGAHRISWSIENGEIKAGYHILHTCDNPRCVNPGHLYSGTHQENMKDRNNRNRQSFLKGELNGMAKLNKQKVTEIKELLLNGKLKTSEIANRFGVTAAQIRYIKRGKSWRCLNV
jgi:hypothetical protein